MIRKITTLAFAVFFVNSQALAQEPIDDSRNDLGIFDLTMAAAEIGIVPRSERSVALANLAWELGNLRNHCLSADHYSIFLRAEQEDLAYELKQSYWVPPRDCLETLLVRNKLDEGTIRYSITMDRPYYCLREAFLELIVANMRSQSLPELLDFAMFPGADLNTLLQSWESEHRAIYEELLTWDDATWEDARKKYLLKPVIPGEYVSEIPCEKILEAPEPPFDHALGISPRPAFNPLNSEWTSGYGMSIYIPRPMTHWDSLDLLDICPYSAGSMIYDGNDVKYDQAVEPVWPSPPQDRPVHSDHLFFLALTLVVALVFRRNQLNRAARNQRAALLFVT